MSRHFPDEVTVIDPKGRKFQQQVVYNWKPMFCAKCQVVGHSCQDKVKPPVQHNERKRGDNKLVTYEWRSKGPISAAA